ncbi:hypothetical protein chiPu_0025121, partial [Chiloscyllium punctatum]|nr:hypothetical protein [Chiloscyllium punctatum]
MDPNRDGFSVSCPCGSENSDCNPRHGVLPRVWVRQGNGEGQSDQVQEQERYGNPYVRTKPIDTVLRRLVLAGVCPEYGSVTDAGERERYTSIA